MFPEGRINPPPKPFNPYTQPHPLLPFKWGVGRVLTLSKSTPLILPIHLTGYNDVFNDDRKYTAIPSSNANITINIGEPINANEGGFEIEDSLNRYRFNPKDYDEKLIRMNVTSIIRQELDNFGQKFDFMNYDDKL